MCSIYGIHLGQARDVLGGMWSMMYMYSVHVLITTSARTDKPVKLTVHYDNLIIIWFIT